MRRVLEAIVSHPTGIDPATFAEIQRYTKLFWINTGPYNNLTARKFVLKTTPQALAAAAKAAASAGASFPTQPNESVDQLLTRLGPMFFDPNVDPSVTNKTPGAGKDILSSSANNLYSGVSLADLRGFTEKYGLNSRLVKTNGRARRRGLPRRRPLRQGDPPDHHAISRRRSPSRPSRWPTPCARSSSGTRTGETADRVKYDIAWVADKASPVDTINGFIEVYMDPRGIKGSWEALVFYVNKEKTERIQQVRGQRAVVRGPHAV